MGKRYDWQVTPQNTPRFKERRLLFLVVSGILVLNLILTGVFLAENVIWFWYVHFYSQDSQLYNVSIVAARCGLGGMSSFGLCSPLLHQLSCFCGTRHICGLLDTALS